MGKKQKAPPEPPSKAYLVSFGDTMTALLAFFIVINSMAQEQTGANLYSGTGSFVSAVNSVGFAGRAPTAKSKYLTKKEAPVPLYALAENLDKNPNQEGNIGPDDEDDAERIIDREKENFQRFLNEIDRQFNLEHKSSVSSQIVFDSFELFKDSDSKESDAILSDHAIQLFAEIAPTLSNEDKFVEIIVWATMPSPVVIEKTLRKSNKILKELRTKFKFPENENERFRLVVKPWLFSDAKTTCHFIRRRKPRKI